MQLLTHGIGFDRTYWDIRAQDYNHSYVARATDQYGFSTFTWDRLGIAQSQHGTDAVNEIQSALEMPALYALRLRGGKIPGIACTFDKVVHIGHSFGSIQSYSMAVLYPEATDSLVLTGFSQAAGFVPYFQFGSDFLLAKGMAQFSDNPGGYLAAGDVTVVQTDFFSPSCFEPELLELGFASSQPVTVGELLTVGAETGETNLLTAPVLIITGGMSSFGNATFHATRQAIILNVTLSPQDAIYLSAGVTVRSLGTHRFQIASSYPGRCLRAFVNSTPSLLRRQAMD